MDPSLFRILHIFGGFLLMAAYGGVILHGLNGGSPSTNKAKGLVSSSHGIAMVLIFLTGFALLGKPVPEGWWLVKLLIWLALGGMLVIANRRPDLGKMLWWAVPVLGGIAAMLCIWKPF